MQRLKDEIIYIENNWYKGVPNEIEHSCAGCYFLSKNELGFMTCTKSRVNYYECSDIIYKKISK